MNNFFNLKSNFAKNVMVVAGGTAVGQVLLLFSMPIITRLYTPEDFGLLAIYVSCIVILSTLASLRFELAIPLPEKDNEALNLVALAFFSLIINCIIIFFLTIVLEKPIVKLLGLNENSEYLWIIPIGVLSLNIYSIGNYCSVIEKNFKSISITKILQSAVLIIIQLAGSKFGFLSLLFGQILGQSLGCYKLINAIYNKYVLIRTKINSETLLASCKIYYQFPIYSTWSGFINALGAQAPNILLLSLYNPAIAGSFYLAQKIIALPVVLVGGAVGQSFLSQAIESKKTNTIFDMSVSLTRKLFIVGFLPSIVIFTFGSDIFLLVFGQEWELAGSVFEMLAISVLLQFITIPIGQLLAVIDKQNIALVLQLIVSFLRIMGIVIGYWLEDYNTSIMLFSILSALGYGLFLSVSLIYAKKYEYEYEYEN